MPNTPTHIELDRCGNCGWHFQFEDGYADDTCEHCDTQMIFEDSADWQIVPLRTPESERELVEAGNELARSLQRFVDKKAGTGPALQNDYRARLDRWRELVGTDG